MDEESSPGEEDEEGLKGGQHEDGISDEIGASNKDDKDIHAFLFLCSVFISFRSIEKTFSSITYPVIIMTICKYSINNSENNLSFF
jgi:hypothetical protein